ncbi:uncharacterized protein A1O9_12495 [Exophiala aquamarina CBS 119918]|uniref:Uncharacterized protein n=1 Tax=Exophiala aquamarina CBS 119918 TaxID=1182545 RepID=A0A072NX14_9EURO|nr:uncharacterized protein A1O9_12495 [Exophiala aquamarina CBS 119918]KEF51578.1 hypothetical protein A1O9_12495 [Exophiala aquamarina CBS 119918]
MLNPDRASANVFVGPVRRVYNLVGFSKSYNFVFFIFAGPLMDFTLARFQYLDYYGILCISPGIGECYFYTKGIEEVGLLMHLSTILPESSLVCFQFVPTIRHKILLFHQINGYLIHSLSLVSTLGLLWRPGMHLEAN